MLTPEQQKLLSIMEEDSFSAEDFFQPSKVLWESMSNIFSKYLNEEGIHDIQSQKFNNYFSLLDTEASNKHYFKCSLWLFYNYLKQQDTFGLLKKSNALLPNNSSLYYDPQTINGRPKDYDNKILTWDYLISLNTLINIAEYYPQIVNEPCVVADLGAGWGRIGYYLTQINPKVSYNILDIPHTLLISQEYIQSTISKEISYYSYLTNKDIPLFTYNFLTQNPGIRFHGTQDLKKFDKKSIDIFINVASFQEMSFNQINSYFELIDNTSHYFYNQQRYSDLEMGYALYPYKGNWNKLFDRDVIFLPLWFENMFKL